jgi:hypothetical protein
MFRQATSTNLQTIEGGGEAEAETPAGLQALCVHDLMQREFPPRETLLGPWLRSQDISMIHAPRGVGKTFMSLSVAMSVASGGNLLSWDAPQANPVWFVDGEMPAATMQERVGGFQLGCEWHAAAGMLRLITPDLQDRGIPDLSDQTGQALIEGQLGDARLLVLDNISTLCRSGVENEAESWVAVQEWVLKLRKKGVTVLLIHHSGKGGQQRGTSKREDVMDCVLSLRRPQDYAPADGARFEVHFEKARGLMGDDVKPLEASLHTGTDGSMVWTWRDVENADRERIVQMSRDGMTTREIAGEVGKSKSTVARILKAAAEDVGQ